MKTPIKNIVRTFLLTVLLSAGSGVTLSAAGSKVGDFIGGGTTGWYVANNWYNATIPANTTAGTAIDLTTATQGTLAVWIGDNATTVGTLKMGFSGGAALSSIRSASGTTTSTNGALIFDNAGNGALLEATGYTGAGLAITNWGILLGAGTGTGAGRAVLNVQLKDNLEIRNNVGDASTLSNNQSVALHTVITNPTGTLKTITLTGTGKGITRFMSEYAGGTNDSQILGNIKVVQASASSELQMYSLNNTYTGGTDITNGGKILARGGGSLGANSSVITFKDGGGTLAFNTGAMNTVAPTVVYNDIVVSNTSAIIGVGNLITNSRSVTLNGDISGTGSLVFKSDAQGATTNNKIILSGRNNFSGFNGGNITIDTARVAFNDTAAWGNITTLTLKNSSAVEFLTPVSTNNSKFVLDSGTIVVGTTGRGNTTIWSGEVSGAGALQKAFVGNLVLTHANTYRGGTIIGGGNVIVQNTTGSATGIGSVTINSGAEYGLGGNGIVAGATTFLGAGILNPGNIVTGEAGVLTFGSDLTIAGATVVNFQEGSLINVGGLLTLGAGWKLNLDGTDLVVDASKYITLFDLGTTGSLSGYVDDATLTSGVTLQGAAQGLSLAKVGNEIRLLGIGAIPEPSTYAAILGALALVVLAIRRRK